MVVPLKKRDMLCYDGKEGQLHLYMFSTVYNDKSKIFSATFIYLLAPWIFFVLFLIPSVSLSSVDVVKRARYIQE